MRCLRVSAPTKFSAVDPQISVVSWYPLQARTRAGELKVTRAVTTARLSLFSHTVGFVSRSPHLTQPRGRAHLATSGLAALLTEFVFPHGGFCFSVSSSRLISCSTYAVRKHDRGRQDHSPRRQQPLPVGAMVDHPGAFVFTIALHGRDCTSITRVVANMQQNTPRPSSAVPTRTVAVPVCRPRVDRSIRGGEQVRSSTIVGATGVSLNGKMGFR